VRDVDLIWEQVVVDAHDPVALGRWWADALGWVVVGDAADEFEIRPTPDRVPGLLFVPVLEEKAGKNRLHLDFRPIDQTAEVERLLSLGARRADVGQRDASWLYSPTLKAMSSASFVDGFGPIPRSRRHRTTRRSASRISVWRRRWPYDRLESLTTMSVVSPSPTSWSQS
jgi:hypothetical protein